MAPEEEAGTHTYQAGMGVVASLRAPAVETTMRYCLHGADVPEADKYIYPGWGEEEKL